MNVFSARMLVMNFLIALMLIFTHIAASHAEEKTPEKIVQLEILLEKNKISAGETITVALKQDIYPKWHTYWINPGDSGAPTRIKWTLPEGFEIGEIMWPAPEKIPYGPLLNYGYENTVVFPQTLTAPADYDGAPIALLADIELLVCEEECIPEFDEISFTLNDTENVVNEKVIVAPDIIEVAVATLPVPVDWTVTVSKDQTRAEYIFGQDTLQTLKNAGIDFTKAAFEVMPADWGIVQNAASTTFILKNGVLQIRQAADSRDISTLGKTGGLLRITENGVYKPVSYKFSADIKTKNTALAALENADNISANQSSQSIEIENTPIKSAAISPDISIIDALIYAFLGGLVLNLMPCVFPVLSIKALTLVKIAEKHPAQAKIHGLSYTSGVILSFIAIAAVLIALKLGGASIGWGFQLQNPIVVTLLAYLIFLLGLNMGGFFEIPSGFANVGGKLANAHGYTGSFFTGILATLVATPCTAPFMGVAIGFALVQTIPVNLGIFAALGFGLAAPYLLISLIPALQKALPKPGAWMETFRQLLAFPLIASAAWLGWVLSQQAGSTGVLGLLFGAVALAFGIWLLKHQPRNMAGKTLVILLAIIALLAPIALLPLSTQSSVKALQTNAGETSVQKFGEAYSNEKLEALLQGNDPIFVEMTAAWCITCKVNHAVAINIDSTKTAFAQNNVQYLIGDWTNYNKNITEFLNRYGRNGVPVYVYYGPRDLNGERPKEQVLPQILTPGLLSDLVSEK